MSSHLGPSFINAPGYGAGWVTLADSGVLLASQAQIDFTNISQAYAALRFLGSPIHSTDTSAAFDDDLNITFNNDSGANYVDMYMSSNEGTIVDTSSTRGTSSIFLSDVTSDGSGGGTGSYPTIFDMVIPGYAGTTFYKQIISWSTVVDTPVSADADFYWEGSWGTWRNTAAISRVTFDINLGNFHAGSRILMQGLAAA